MPDSNLDAWRGRLVGELVRCEPPAVSPEEAERHAMYAHGLLAIAHHYWNGNKYGRHLRYPLNTVVDPTAERGAAGGTYLGHNIAALAVDADGRVIDFDFNHNEVFNSSVEHAESRLLRRLFSLTQIQDTWKTAGNGSVAATSQNEGYYGNLLSGVTLYTTLESCAQCSGIMALAKVKQVVYLQTDPGQYGVGNIMRNMTAGTGLPAPQPVPAERFGFEIHRDLDAAYLAFRNRGPDQAMVTDAMGAPTSDARTTSITSFLCTKVAQDQIGRASCRERVS
jgi:tRNA(Arg) A34 adenosine deaminase TadA